MSSLLNKFQLNLVFDVSSKPHRTNLILVRFGPASPEAFGLTAYDAYFSDTILKLFNSGNILFRGVSKLPFNFSCQSQTCSRMLLPVNRKSIVASFVIVLPENVVPRDSWGLM